MKRFCLMLTITNQCNLKCIYCYEGSKDLRRMHISTAQRIIRERIKLHGNEDLEIDFHGGEPFMNFQLIRELCEWCWNEFPSYTIKFFATTNGTILTQEVKEWLTENKKRFAAALSLDGTLEMNYQNRGTRLSEDTIRFFCDLWPEQPVKMTVSKETLSGFAEGVKYIHSYGLKVNANLAYGLEWENTQVETYRNELFKLADFYLQNPDVETIPIFSKHLTPILEKDIIVRHCGTGKNMMAFDVEGNAYPCQMFIPNTLDKKRWNDISNLDFENEDSLYDDVSCKKCLIHNICPTCYGNNFIERGSIGKRDKRLCPFIMAEKEALSYYRIKQILRKDVAEISQEEYLELAAAKRIITHTETNYCSIG